MNIKKVIAMMVLCSFTGANLQARNEATHFINPVIWADVPDPDVIRVGDDFYLISTTMHLMPGGPLMHSKDLVNWHVESYLFDKLTDSPKYDMKEGTAYGRGQWATSLKYHKGVFYALFAPNDSRGGDTYIFTTRNPKKGWKIHARLPHFHDASLFFDDDDRVYVFHGTGWVQELTKDLKGIKEGGLNKLLFERDSTENALLEGSRVVKHNGMYYLLMVSWPSDRPRRQVCYRARQLDGDWEKKIILEDNFAEFPYVGQGTIVDDDQGNWYGFIFQDRGGVGRVPTLMPCNWVDGWPMLGDKDGNVPLSLNIPCEGVLNKNKVIVSSDNFRRRTLNLNWQWNHNPIDDAWSLKERRGWLRLRTARLSESVFDAPNTITQRMMGPTSVSTVKMNVGHMLKGDKAGVCAFNSDAGLLMVTRDNGNTIISVEESSIKMDEEKYIQNVSHSVKESVMVKSDVVYLRVSTDFRLHRDIATFSYSTDGENWHSIGGEFKMRFDHTRFFMGTRLAIFNYATQQLGGYIDVDWFKVDVSEK